MILQSAIVNLAIPHQGERWVRLRSGVSVIVDLADHNGRELAVMGGAELGTVKLCRSMMQPGWTFLDIGANYGAVGFGVADLAGELHFVEPNPSLCERIRCAGPASYTLHECALGETAGHVDLVVPDGWSGRGSIADEFAGQRVRVEMRATRDLLASITSWHPIAVKLDVEGAEALVLPALLKDPRVAFVVAEMRDTTKPALIQAARAHGFEAALLRPGLLSMVKDPDVHAARGGSYDVLLAKPLEGRTTLLRI